jgi:hypothetical protein
MWFILFLFVFVFWNVLGTLTFIEMFDTPEVVEAPRLHRLLLVVLCGPLVWLLAIFSWCYLLVEKSIK